MSKNHIIVEEHEIDLDPDNLPSYILDLSLEQDIRINALEQLCDSENNNAIEIVSQLTGMYQFSGTTILAKFLYKVCTHSSIPAFLKLEFAKSLLSFLEQEEDSDSEDDNEMKEIKTQSNTAIQKRNLQRQSNGYKALDIVCYDLEGVPTPCRIDAICTLMKCKTYKNQVNTYFIEIINDQTLDCDYRYKTILSLEKKHINDAEFFLKKACLKFVFETQNMTMYRILAGQYLLQKCELSEIEHDKIETTILEFAEDNVLDYDLRADAADMLLSLASETVKNRARDIIVLLGRSHGDVKTIFDNAQNVHTNEVEASVLETLEALAIIPVLCINKNPIDFDYICNKIENELKNQKEEIKNECKDNCSHTKCKHCDGCVQSGDAIYCNNKCNELYTRDDRIRVALNRIYMDRILYSKFNNTLSNILLKIWSYLHEHEHEQEMKDRLLQELVEMSGTCSTGFASRLVNVISGFGEYNLRISWEDQLVANFAGRLNARARYIDSSDSVFFQSKLRDVVELWLNRNKHIKQGVIEKLTKSKGITDLPTMNDIITYHLDNSSEEDIRSYVEDFKEEVFNEMMLCASQFHNRQNFLLFFRTSMLSIREELYEEFKEFITDTDFDLYCRKAIMVYEGEN